MEKNEGPPKRITNNNNLSFPVLSRVSFPCCGIARTYNLNPCCWNSGAIKDCLLPDVGWLIQLWGLGPLPRILINSCIPSPVHSTSFLQIFFERWVMCDRRSESDFSLVFWHLVCLSVKDFVEDLTFNSDNFFFYPHTHPLFYFLFLICLPPPSLREIKRRIF